MNDKSTRRLFFALWPDQQVRDRLAMLQQQFPAQTGRYNHPQDLHMTLVFLGPVEAQRFDCVVNAASQVRFEPFSLRIDQIAYWNKPRILHCGPSRTPVPLPRLVADLQTALLECGFAPEKRRYVPHVTLARKVQSAAQGSIEHGFEWPVLSFVLAGSGGKGPGPRYAVLKKWCADS